MNETWTPLSAPDVRDAVRASLHAGQSLELMGRGTRRAFGRPVDADVTLDLSSISGIRNYQPEELILVAAPGTPLDDVIELLATNSQHLAFEPPNLGAVWGNTAANGTLGGAILTGQNGPRRMSAGGARDQVLGVKGVNGFGEDFVSGGRVVKNVTGFDLGKLIAGSFGTLCAVTELTLKVLPRPADAATFALFGLADDAAHDWMQHAVNVLPVPVSSAAHLPADVVRDSGNAAVAGRERSATLLRLEGFAESVDAGIGVLERAAGTSHDRAVLDQATTRTLWSEIADVRFFSGTDLPIWKLSVPPALGIAVGSRLARQLAARVFYDWAGAAVWIEAPSADDAHAASVRGTMRELTAGDSHATLVRAAAAIRRRIAPFEPLARAVADLNERVRRHFDPHGIFNPGRVHSGA